MSGTREPLMDRTGVPLTYSMGSRGGGGSAEGPQTQSSHQEGLDHSLEGMWEVTQVFSPSSPPGSPLGQPPCCPHAYPVPVHTAEWGF